MSRGKNDCISPLRERGEQAFHALGFFDYSSEMFVTTVPMNGLLPLIRSARSG